MSIKDELMRGLGAQSNVGASLQGYAPPVQSPTPQQIRAPQQRGGGLGGLLSGINQGLGSLDPMQRAALLRIAGGHTKGQVAKGLGAQADDIVGFESQKRQQAFNAEEKEADRAIDRQRFDVVDQIFA